MQNRFSSVIFPPREEELGKAKKIGGGLAATGAAAVTCFTAARSSIPASPPPDIVDILQWILSGNDLLALSGAIVAAVSAGYSIWQMFQPSPPSKDEVEAVVAEDGAQTRRYVDDLSGQLHQEGQASEQRDSAMLIAIQTDRSGFTPADIREDRISEPKALELGEAIVEYLRKSRPELAEDMIERIGGATTRAAESKDERRREVAALMAEGRYAEAGALQQDIAAEQDEASAEAHRDAGRILSLTNIAAAIVEFGRATDLDPAHFWTWTELSRLHALAGSLGNARRCAERALQHVTGERDRMVVESELGDLSIAEGNLCRGRAHFEAAMRSAELRASSDPDVTVWQRDLSVSYERLGDVEVASGNLGAARERYEAGLAIRDRLAKQEPGNTEWRRDLSVSYNKLGDVEVASGNLGAARERYEAGLAIADRLAKQEPGNTQWQRDLSVSYDRLGDVEVASGNLGAARERYEAGLAIRDRLAKQEPGNTQWQRDLSVSYNKLGDVEVASGNLGAARERYEAGLAIRDRLAKQEPGNAEWQRDLVVSNAKFAQVAEAAGDRPEALWRFGEAERVMAALAAQRPDHPGFARDLARIRAEIAGLTDEA